MDWDLVERALGDPAFCAVIETLGHRLVSSQELASMELPEGLTPELLWKICLRLRRLTGFHVFDAQQRWGAPGIWYNLPQEVVKRIGSIYARSGPHSPLGRVLSARDLSGFRLDAQAREISDSLRRDGLYLPLEAARSMASQERPRLREDQRLSRRPFG